MTFAGQGRLTSNGMVWNSADTRSAGGLVDGDADADEGG